MSVTMGQILVGAQGIIGEVPGIGVQEFGDDRMLADAVRAFDLLFTRYPWPHYRVWSQHTLDGTLGVVDSDAFTSVRGPEDFLLIYRDDQRKPLPVLGSRTNPFALSGSTVACWTHLPVTDANYATRRLQFYPKASTDTVTVLSRVYPATAAAPWTTASIIYLDQTLMEYATAFMSLSLDDLNPNGASVVQQLMDLRFTDITSALSQQAPAAVSQGSGLPYSDWLTVP